MTPHTSRVVWLSGATGSIGQALVGRLVAADWQVRAGTREPALQAAREPRLQWTRFDITAAPDLRALRNDLEGCGAMVHLAWHTDPIPERGLARNVEAARALFDAAEAVGVGHRVFISSMSGHARALSAYGRGKWQVEQGLDPARDLVIRPGFVLADGGVSARLTSSLLKSPIVPLFDGGRQPIQTIGRDDLCAAIVAALKNGLVGRLTVAHPQVMTVAALYRALLASHGRSKPALSLPGRPALWAMRAVERLGIQLPMTSENLLGLLALEAAEVQADLGRLDMTPQSCDELLRRN